jgi:hypothetical protein
MTKHQAMTQAFATSDYCLMLADWDAELAAELGPIQDRQVEYHVRHAVWCFDGHDGSGQCTWGVMMAGEPVC